MKITCREDQYSPDYQASLVLLNEEDGLPDEAITVVSHATLSDGKWELELTPDFIERVAMIVLDIKPDDFDDKEWDRYKSSFMIEWSPVHHMSLSDLEYLTGRTIDWPAFDSISGDE